MLLTKMKSMLVIVPNCISSNAYRRRQWRKTNTMGDDGCSLFHETGSFTNFAYTIDLKQYDA